MRVPRVVSVVLTVTAAGAVTVGLGACNRSTDTSRATPSSAPRADPPATAAADAACPTAAAHDDPLVHLGRAQGDTFIEILEVEARSSFVFACTATQGLTIWDASEPASMTLVAEGIGPAGLAHGRFPRCQHLAFTTDGSQLVLTNHGDEVQPTPFVALYEMADPTAPSLSATWSGKAPIEGVDFDGSKIVAAAHHEGILLFERRRDALSIAGRFRDDDSEAWAVTVEGGRVFVAEGATGLRIYERSEQEIRLVGTLDLPGSSRDLIVDGKTQRAYVATSDGLAVVDVSTPASPRLVSHTDTPGTSLAVALGRPDHVFVADWGQVRGYDVSDPAAPKLDASQTVPTEADFSRVLGLDATEEGLVFAGEWQGMHAFAHHPGVEAPDVELEGAPIHFGRVAVGQASTQKLWVNNDGDAPLVVQRISSDSPQLTVSKSCFTVEPGGSEAIEMTLTVRNEQPLSTTLTIASDDPDEPLVQAKALANQGGLGVGDEAPPLRGVDLQGRVWDLAELRGKVVVLAYFATF